MAKTDNLTDFLTGVADAIRTKKGTTAKINPQNFETEIGSITTSKPEQEKTAALSMSSGNQIVSPDSGKVLSKVTITKPTTLTPENIKKNIEIGGVVGTLEMKPEQEKTAALSMLNGDQIVSPDSGKVLSKVTITKPATLTPENIRKDTNIGGVVGTLEEAKPEQEKTAEATNSRQIISPDNGKALSKVVIEAAPLPSMWNSEYKNINKCLINQNNKILILGCDNSIIPSDGSVTSIGNSAFFACSGIADITIPDSVISIDSDAFFNCHGLTSITIPHSVTSIGDRAFRGCTGFTSVIIGSGVTSIGEGAFDQCVKLTSITIPDSVTSIGDGAFGSCARMESLIVATGNKKYHSANNCIIETDAKTLVVGCKTSVIPSDGSVTSIGNSAFSGCNGLTSIIIPDGVISINRNAFSTCDGLTSVTIPDSVTSIGDGAFFYCTGLTSVTIGNSVTYIGSDAFYNCSGLTSIIMLPTTPPKLGSDVIPSNVTTITVPAGCGDAYKTAAGWSAYADKIVEATA